MADVDGSVDRAPAALVARAGAGARRDLGATARLPRRRHRPGPAGVAARALRAAGGVLRAPGRPHGGAGPGRGRSAGRARGPGRRRGGPGRACGAGPSCAGRCGRPGPGPVRPAAGRDPPGRRGRLALLSDPARALLPGRPAAGLLAIRLRERTDRPDTGPPDLAHVEEVERYEDFAAQNPFTAVGLRQARACGAGHDAGRAAGLDFGVPARVRTATTSPASGPSTSPAGCRSTTAAG